MELTAVSGRIAEFRERGCDVLGVSTDSVETHERWLTTRPTDGGLGPLSFPLAAEPDGTVCRAYGVYLERQQVAMRGLFLIDPNGVLQYQVVHSLSVGRDTDEVLRVLEGLQTGGVCPGGRRRGDPVLDPSRELGPNRVVGPYRIEEELGGGSFGTVFRARAAGRGAGSSRAKPPQHLHHPRRRLERGRFDDRHGVHRRRAALEAHGAGTIASTPGGRLGPTGGPRHGVRARSGRRPQRPKTRQRPCYADRHRQDRRLRIGAAEQATDSNRRDGSLGPRPAERHFGHPSPYGAGAGSRRAGDAGE